MNTDTLIKGKHSLKLKNDKDSLLWNKLLSWDLSRVKDFLVKRMSYNLEDAEEIEYEYKKFLFLNIKYAGNRIPMSKLVDDIWHAHLLHTRNYSKLCSEVAGFFIHHTPTNTDEENIELEPLYLNNTRGFMKESFGEVNEKFWPADPRFACCDCAGCQ
jgi:hypothetical protein